MCACVRPCVRVCVCVSVGVFISCYCCWLVLLLLLAPPGRSSVGYVLISEEEKTLTRDVFDTFATHSSHVHDVTDTDCWAQTGSTYGRIFATLRGRFIARADIKVKTAVFLFSFFLIDS